MKAEKEMMWPGMSRKKFLKLGAYLRETANQLGLRDWFFEMNYAPLSADGDVIATVRCIYGRKRASVRLVQDFAQRSKEEQRMVIIHELLHCHTERIEQPLRHGQAAWKILGDSAADVLSDQIHLAIEDAVDGIAETIAERFPLP